MKYTKAETQQQQLIKIAAHQLSQRVSAYGVLMRDGRVLMVKTHSENWELPGGKPEPGETLVEGLKREFVEEVGIKVSVGHMFYMRESFYHTPSGKNYHSLQFFFHVTSDQSPTPAEAISYSFLPFAVLSKSTVNTSSYLALQHSMEAFSYNLWGESA